ncbi:MAG: hypothetical protein C0456_10905 [Hyphomonas sp.]|uniref:hypothetical protein n=1 Tax=Hyphomonas sp. TaxID=87 RepID=UPI001D9E10E9|nr:hypothetical protein [Hyphomonas sp.]MBA4227128.1 hypothetical protein [Hyphomonas sp.]
MRIRDLEDAIEKALTPFIEDIVITKDGISGQLLEEGKWIKGRFEKNIRIDQPTHGVGQTHAHVYGRKGDEHVVVNVDGSASHKSKGRLHDKDADALREIGFNIPNDNIVECEQIEALPSLLLG